MREFLRKARYDRLWEERLPGVDAALRVPDYALLPPDLRERLQLDRWQRHTKDCALCRKVGAAQRGPPARPTPQGTLCRP